MICLYCLEDKGPSEYLKAEHVIPQSFGRFENNLTLIHRVCDDCNKFFGDNLEIALGRDSLEGGMRFSTGVKEPEEFKSFGRNSRIVLRVAEGEFAGAYVYRRFSEDENKIIVSPLPQVGFCKKSDNAVHYFLLNEQLPDKASLEASSYDLAKGAAIRVLGIDYSSAQKLLLAKGIDFKFGGLSEPANKTDLDWKCEIEGTIDTVIMRAMAKIAFNYLAYWNEQAFVLNQAFNSARRFIRFGEMPAYKIALSSSDPLLSDESEDGKRVLGHMVTVDWAEEAGSIVAQVSLFNQMKHVICLARDFEGQRPNIRKGHLFSPHNRKIYELGARARQADE